MRTVLFVIAAIMLCPAASAAQSASPIDRNRLHSEIRQAVKLQLPSFDIDAPSTVLERAERNSRTSLLFAAQDPSGRRNHVWLGLGLGVAAASTVVWAKCKGSGERTDCYRAGAVIVLPIGAGAGALVGALFKH